MQQTAQSPLLLDGWLEFNRLKLHIQPLRMIYALGEAESPAIETVYYINRAGKLVSGLAPYLPVHFKPTPTQSIHRIYRQWLAVAEPMVRDMRKRGICGSIALPPEVTDVRPWQWAGFQVSVRYTFYNEFPWNIQHIDPAVRRKIKQAHQAGYRCERSSNLQHALDCLKETERRQGFRDDFSVGDLEKLRELLGDEYFRTYVCYAPDGEPASTRLILHSPRSRAIDWMVGTRTKHLPSGATQLLIQHVLDDLQAAGASGFDFEGANIPSVAASKMNWGGQLVPWYIVDTYTMRSLARWSWYWFQFMRRNGKVGH